MKVKIKTQDNYFDMVKLKCSAVEFLILKSALNQYAHGYDNGFVDRYKATEMLKDIEEGYDNARRSVLDS